MQEIENEIDVLESTLGYLEMAMREVSDSPYHTYMAQGWELDVEEIRSRLEELYEMQNRQWQQEMQQQNLEFDKGRL